MLRWKDILNNRAVVSLHDYGVTKDVVVLLS